MRWLKYAVMVVVILAALGALGLATLIWISASID